MSDKLKEWWDGVEGNKQPAPSAPSGEATIEKLCDHCGNHMPEGYEVVRYNGKIGRLHSECVDATQASCAPSGEEEARAFFVQQLKREPVGPMDEALIRFGAKFAAHIRQQQKEKDAKIAEEWMEADGYNASDLVQHIASAIRSGE